MLQSMLCSRRTYFEPSAAGTKCGGLLAEYRALNQRMRQEARATFKEFEASIARDSNKHVVMVRSCKRRDALALHGHAATAVADISGPVSS